ncbi:hypothetical protein AAMO2058_001549400 [Amorphochlora amoebiformis]
MVIHWPQLLTGTLAGLFAALHIFMGTSEIWSPLQKMNQKERLLLLGYIRDMEPLTEDESKRTPIAIRLTLLFSAFSKQHGLWRYIEISIGIHWVSFGVVFILIALVDAQGSKAWPSLLPQMIGLPLVGFAAIYSSREIDWEESRRIRWRKYGTIDDKVYAL